MIIMKKKIMKFKLMVEPNHQRANNCNNNNH